MTIAEKIQVSADKTRFTLFKEGLFYKVNSKFVKSIGAEVLSLGFPASETEKGHLTLQSISEAIEATVYKEKPYGIAFSLKMDIKQNYLEYFEEIQKSKNIVAETLLEYNTTPKDLLVKMIQEFDLANSMPMQGLAFIQELKFQIKTQG